MTSVREETERLEEEVLAPWATRARESRGRKRPEAECDLRTCFQRDRDRILHSKAFRRLKHKTQVFLSPAGDHFRVRLTHTLEVAQVARTIARALRLNEDLTEAIALGHDLGHTPFGHVGEDAFSSFLGEPFHHSEQSLRVVEYVERGGEGLNLTEEVLDGILNHSWERPEPFTPEGKVVRLADRIAYLNHDLDDAVRAGVLEAREVPREVLEYLGATHGQRIDSLVRDVVNESRARAEVAMSQVALEVMDRLRAFMFERVYLSPEVRGEQEKAIHILTALAAWHLEHPEALPPEVLRAPGGLKRKVVDYVAGMTDRFAIRRYLEIFVPNGWGSRLGR